MADELARGCYPSHAADAAFRRALASFLRSAASPGAALVFERCCGHGHPRRAGDDPGARSRHAARGRRGGADRGRRHLAANIPGARLLELDGADHYPFSGDQEPLMDRHRAVHRRRARAEVDFDRVLATVLFTDIVGSTETAVRMADRPGGTCSRRTPARPIAARDVREREVDVAGDGFLAVFDGPARAVRCGLAICEDARALGVDVRVGVHTGEVELDGAAERGIAVHIGARVAAQGRCPARSSSRARSRTSSPGSGLALRESRRARAQGRAGAWHALCGVAPDPARTEAHATPGCARGAGPERARGRRARSGRRRPRCPRRPSRRRPGTG